MTNVDWSSRPSVKPDAWVATSTHPRMSEKEIIEWNRKVAVKHLAVAFIDNHGEAAIMMAIAEMTSDKALTNGTADKWRDVITEIERIQSYDKDRQID